MRQLRRLARRSDLLGGVCAVAPSTTASTCANTSVLGSRVNRTSTTSTRGNEQRSSSTASFSGGVRAPDCRWASTSAQYGPLYTRRSISTSPTSSAPNDYYAILGVPKSASDSDIKKAYYKLAKKYHPDANPNDAAAHKKFTDIRKAYDTLKEPEKRRIYDQMGPEAHERMEQGGGGGPRGNPFGGGPFGGPFGGGFAGGTFRGGAPPDMDDLFAQFFGGGGMNGPFGAGGGSMRGTRVSVRLTFLESIRGAPRTLRLNGQELDVQIPAGVESGTRLRVDGVGRRDPRTGQPTPVYVDVEVEPHPVLKREGADIVATISVPYTRAVLGGTVDVPTVDGEVRLTVPAGTQPGDRLLMRGRGLPTPFGKGNQIVVMQVRVPRVLTPRQRALWEELQVLEGGGSSNKGTNTADTKQQKGWGWS